MARLQILELPSGADDDRPPFILVVDEWDVDTLDAHAALTDYWDAFGKKIGARGVLFVDRRIDIPANDTSAYLRDSEADERAEPQRADERAIQAEEKLKAFMEKRYTIEQERKASLTDALGLDRLRDWDDIRNAAAGVRKQRDTQAEKLDRVRQESARIRATTRTWGPVADLIDGALNGNQESDDETSTGRPKHPDGTPYNYSEITAGGWEHCDGCRTWGRWTAENPHACPTPNAAHTPDA